MTIADNVTPLAGRRKGRAAAKKPSRKDLVTIKNRDMSFTLRGSTGGKNEEIRFKSLRDMEDGLKDVIALSRAWGQATASMYLANDVDDAKDSIAAFEGEGLRAGVLWFDDRALLVVRHTEIHGGDLEAFAEDFRAKVLETGPTDVWETVTANHSVDVADYKRIEYIDGAAVDAKACFRNWGSVAEKPEHSKEKYAASQEPEIDASELAKWLEIDRARLENVPTWIIDGMIAEGTVGLLSARKSNLKTFVAHGICAAIATGTPFNDLPVQTGGVAYMAAENPAGVAMRHRAWLYDTGEDVPHFVVSGLRFPLHNKASAVAMAKALAAQPQFKEHPLKVIVLDTIGSTMAGQKINGEAFNNDKDTVVNTLYSHARAAAAAIGGVILFVHHDGKDEKKGTRGSSAWEDDADFVLKTKKIGSGEDTMVTLSHTKSKNGEELPDRNFPMRLIDLDPADVKALEAARAKTGDVPDQHGKNNAAAYRVTTGDKTLAMRLVATVAAGIPKDAAPRKESQKAKVLKGQIVKWLHMVGEKTQKEIIDRHASNKVTMGKYLAELTDDGLIGKLENGKYYAIDPDEDDDDQDE